MVEKWELGSAAKDRWTHASFSFKCGDRVEGWVHLLVMGMYLAAASGEMLRSDLATIARDAGLIE